MPSLQPLACGGDGVNVGLLETGGNSDEEDDQLLGKDGCGTSSINPHTAAPKAGSGLHWVGAASMITSIILGLGVLGLPLAFSRLGWMFGVVVVVVGAGGAVYSGLLIGRVVAAATAKSGGDRPKTYAALAGVRSLLASCISLPHFGWMFLLITVYNVVQYANPPFYEQQKGPMDRASMGDAVIDGLRFLPHGR